MRWWMFVLFTTLAYAQTPDLVGPPDPCEHADGQRKAWGLCPEKATLPAGMTVYSAPPQYPTGGPLVILANNLTCQQCEGGPFWLSGMAPLYVDCTGLCTVQLVCRPAGTTHDFVLATAHTDAGGPVVVALVGGCPAAFFQVTENGGVVHAWSMNAPLN